MPVLEVKHIEKHFGATRVLEDISFQPGKKARPWPSSGLRAAARPPCCGA